MQNARAMRDLFDGLETPYLDAVLLNTAAVLMLAEKARTFYDGVNLARMSIARGDARRKLEELVEASHE